MAKGPKTFASKVSKDDNAASTKMVRVIRSVKDPATGAVKFMDRMESVPADGDVGANVAKILKD